MRSHRNLHILIWFSYFWVYFYSLSLRKERPQRIYVMFHSNHFKEKDRQIDTNEQKRIDVECFRNKCNIGQANSQIYYKKVQISYVLDTVIIGSTSCMTRSDRSSIPYSVNFHENNGRFQVFREILLTTLFFQLKISLMDPYVLDYFDKLLFHQ